MLTDVQLRRLTPAEKPYKRADTGGLFILVQPNGSRLWRMKYRFGGREKLLSFGAYPEVSLAAARDARDAARSELRADRDLDSNDRPRARPILVVSGHGQERVYSLKRDCL
ncbi:integrase [Gluconobacter frateurii NBRC 103465]|nr:integrase [Gluconobacter frateurii NBRC 103465]